MSLENHFSQQQQWESLCTFQELKVMDVSGPGMLTFWRGRFFQSPTQWGAGQAATPFSQGWSDFATSCCGFFSRPAVWFSVLGVMSQQQPRCVDRSKERERRMSRERERLRKPERGMKTAGAKERDRWRKTPAGNGVRSAPLGEFQAHFLLGPLLVLLRSQEAALWWEVDVKARVLPGIISVPARLTCSYNCPQALQSFASHNQRRWLWLGLGLG